MKLQGRPNLLQSMADEKKDTQPDKNVASEEHPRPSQAEGDLETVEEDLEEKSDSDSKKS